MKKYPWLSLRAVEAAVPAMEASGAAAVARGAKASTVTREGFVEAYRAVGGKPARMQTRIARGTESWARRRTNFIKRHMAQVKANKESLFSNGVPTARLLGLIAWAYVPPVAEKRVARWYDAGAPGVAMRRKNPKDRPLAFQVDETESFGALKLYISVKRGTRTLGYVTIGLHRPGIEHDALSWDCTDAVDVLKAQGARFDRLAVVDIISVKRRYRGLGIGVALYAKAAEVAWRRWRAALVAEACVGGDTSPEAVRAWYSRRLRQIVDVVDTVAVWKELKNA